MIQGGTYRLATVLARCRLNRGTLGLHSGGQGKVQYRRHGTFTTTVLGDWVRRARWVARYGTSMMTAYQCLGRVVLEIDTYLTYLSEKGSLLSFSNACYK